MGKQTAHDSLTPREREVLSLTQQGLTNDEIASYLGISRDGVRYHLKELHSKLGTEGDRAVLRRSRWFGIVTLFGGLGEFARPVVTATAVVALSAGGYLGVRYAAAQSDDEHTDEACAAEIFASIPGEEPPPPGPSYCFESDAALQAFYDCLEDGDSTKDECAAGIGGTKHVPGLPSSPSSTASPPGDAVDLNRPHRQMALG